MAKRRPGSELNDRNWDIEEEPEEAGVFTKASNDVMKERIIKKAKRHTAGGSDGNGAKPAVFGGFAGLTASKPSQAKDTGSNGFAAKPAKLSFGGASSNCEEEEKESVEDSKYFQSLKSLNESVLGWIKKHVEENPYIVLTPIFQDYEKYIKNIETKKSSSSSTYSSSEGASGESHSTIASFKKDETKEESSNGSVKPFAFGASSESTPASKPFSFGSTSTSSSNGGFKFSTTSPGTGFSFSKKEAPPTKETEEKKTFSFGLSGGSAAKEETKKDKPFSFGLSSGTTSTDEVKKPFSFGLTGSSQTSGFSLGAAGSSAASGGATASKDEEEYVPPKNEVKEIKEDDALFSIRCKLYFQKEGGWTERGVGNLHLKPVADTKTQLLIRADTNLGNILLNIMLSASMPASRQGKNNVFVVCVANPPISGKSEEEAKTPTPMLIRVKTGEDADQLLDKINERKQLLA